MASPIVRKDVAEVLGSVRGPGGGLRWRYRLVCGHETEQRASARATREPAAHPIRCPVCTAQQEAQGAA